MLVTPYLQTQGVSGAISINRVKVLSTSNTPLNSTSVDGVALNSGDSVLLTGNGVDNGVYLFDTTLTRHPSYDEGAKVGLSMIYVEAGTYPSSTWICTNISGSDIVGVNTLSYQQVSGSGVDGNVIGPDNPTQNCIPKYLDGVLTNTNLTSTGNDFIINGLILNPASSGTLNIPSLTSDTIAILSGNQTLTNKTLNGDNNTLTNIACNRVVVNGGFQSINLGTPSNGQFLVSNGSSLSWQNGVTTKGDLLCYDGVQTRFPVGTDGQFLTADSSQTTGLKWTTLGSGGGSFNGAMTYVTDQKSSGTQGGTFSSGSWIVRTLNTISSTSAGISLASNILTIPAGTYYVMGGAPATSVQNHQARLWNITDGLIALNGTSSFSSSTSTTYSYLNGYFTITSTKNMRVEHQCNQTSNTTGFGRASGYGTEIYTFLNFIKM